MIYSISWKGRGNLIMACALLGGFLASIGVHVCLEALEMDNSTKWAIGVFFIGAAIGAAICGVTICKPETREYDPITGNTVTISREHSLYGMSPQTWTAILAFLAIPMGIVAINMGPDPYGKPRKAETDEAVSKFKAEAEAALSSATPPDGKEESVTTALAQWLVKYVNEPQSSAGKAGKAEGFRAYCYMTDNRTLVLLHVPHFSALDADARDKFERGVARLVDQPLISWSFAPLNVTLMIHDESGFHAPLNWTIRDPDAAIKGVATFETKAGAAASDFDVVVRSLVHEKPYTKFAYYRVEVIKGAPGVPVVLPAIPETH